MRTIRWPWRFVLAMCVLALLGVIVCYGILRLRSLPQALHYNWRLAYSLQEARRVAARPAIDKAQRLRGQRIVAWIDSSMATRSLDTTLLDVTVYGQRPTDGRGMLRAIWGGDQPLADGIVLIDADDRAFDIPFNEATLAENEANATQVVVFSATVLAEEMPDACWDAMLRDPTGWRACLRRGDGPVGNPRGVRVELPANRSERYYH